VHAHVSRQYQRRSGQALPPSATIWPAGKRMPHIQQDLALACSAQYRTERSWPVTACSPGRLSARAVVPARGAGTFTGAAGASNGGGSRPSARSASGSSGRSLIPDVLASYGQLVSMCTPPRPFAGTWPTPVRVPAVALALPFTGARAHPSVSFQGLTIPDPALRPDKFPVKVQPPYEPLRRVMWTTSIFSLCTGENSVLLGDCPDMGARRHRNPQHFPACAQARCLFAQVIHRFVHRKVSQQESCRARRQRQNCAQVRARCGRHAGRGGLGRACGPDRARCLALRSRAAPAAR
jgi:hypothetical protein